MSNNTPSGPNMAQQAQISNQLNSQQYQQLANQQGILAGAGYQGQNYYNSSIIGGVQPLEPSYVQTTTNPLERVLKAIDPSTIDLPPEVLDSLKVCSRLDSAWQAFVTVDWSFKEVGKYKVTINYENKTVTFREVFE